MKPMKTFKTTIEREVRDENGEVDTVEVEVRVEYEYHRAHRGARDSLGGVRGAGPALEPDEPAHVEILGAVEVANGRAAELTDEETERVSLEIEEHLADLAADVPGWREDR
jgi:hypothetical protein